MIYIIYITVECIIPPGGCICILSVLNAAGQPETAVPIWTSGGRHSLAIIPDRTLSISLSLGGCMRPMLRRYFDCSVNDIPFVLTYPRRYTVCLIVTRAESARAEAETNERKYMFHNSIFRQEVTLMMSV